MLPPPHPPRLTPAHSKKALRNSRIVSQKDDVHVCIMCLRAIMNYQVGQRAWGLGTDYPPWGLPKLLGFWDQLSPTLSPVESWGRAVSLSLKRRSTDFCPLLARSPRIPWTWLGVWTYLTWGHRHPHQERPDIHRRAASGLFCLEG